MKKYALFPGPVTGSDGDVHHLSGTELANCYGVPLSECYVIRYTEDCHGRIDILNKLPHLPPRDDGEYTDNYVDVVDQLMRRSVLDPPLITNG